MEFLEHPDRYGWVRFEADEFGALDDIVALRSNGKYVVRQIKFTVDSDSEDYEVTWGWLLDRPPGQRGERPSLLMKWAASLTQLLEAGRVHEAALFTNRKAATEISSVMTGDRIDFAALPDASRRDKIITQLGNEDIARAFFNEFQLRLDCPGQKRLKNP